VVFVDGVDPDTLLQLITLLAGGLTDAKIAKQLGWSQRTVQRRIAQIHEAIGASSRFQAGFLLAARYATQAPTGAGGSASPQGQPTL
jgi:DNA-binding NarL/FixJ family response regulator